MDDVGIVVPAYRPDPERLCRYVRSLQALDPAVVLVELDAPREHVRERLRDAPARVHTTSERRGKGAAITEGFDRLSTPSRVFVDADGSTPADAVTSLVAELSAGADVAVGSRRHPDATVTTHQTVVRRLMGDVFARLARLTLPIVLHDYQCGAKAVTATAWDEVRDRLHEPGFAWDLEFVAAADALGQTVVEVPVEWTDHDGSTVDPVRTPVELFRALLVVRHRVLARAGHPVHRSLSGDPAPIVGPDEE